MIINHNLSAMNGLRHNRIADTAGSKSMSRLSSGLRINQAAEDAAGLAISEKMRSQIRGLNQASRNALDGISLIQTAEGYLKETTSVLQRIRELAVETANGTLTDADRRQTQVEIDQLVDEVDRIASQAQFNTMNLLTGRFAKEDGQAPATGSMWFHIGPNVDQRVRVYVGAMTSKVLGLMEDGTDTVFSLETIDSSNQGLVTLDNALQVVSAQRADLGAYQNRLEHAIEGIEIGAENLQAAESRIRDLDMAKEMVQFTRNSLLTQTSMAMIAQANQRPNLIMQLLG